jgi:hypothetical protein
MVAREIVSRATAGRQRHITGRRAGEAATAAGAMAASLGGGKQPARAGRGMG